MRRRICAIIGILVVMLAFTAYAGSSWKCTQCGHMVPEYLGDVCPYCGAQKHVHTWKEATCTEPKTCTECRETEGSAAGHQWDGGREIQEATCQSPGVMRYTCIVCGSTRDEELAKDPANHIGGTEIRNAQDATCTENGYSGDTYCKGCGELISSGSTIKALGHEWQDATYTAPKTCERCGATEGEPLEAVEEIITFGHYEQDNDLSNGKEPIEWIVLECKGDTAVLLSKYGLDVRAYNTSWSDVTWEECTLRTWLNGEFLNSAFTAEEQRQLETVTVTADKNPYWREADPGKSTNDKVFLLSINEANKYFSSDEARICFPSEYTKARGAYLGESGTACWWWLRTPGMDANLATFGMDNGRAHVGGRINNCDDGSVRPAVVLRLSDISALAPAAVEGASPSATTDKTFSGTAEGFGGDVTVTIEVKDGRLASVSAVGDNETMGIGSFAIEMLPNEILEVGTWDVDAIAGCTITSSAVREAAKAAMQEAGLFTKDTP